MLNVKMRIARPSRDLSAAEKFYTHGLGFEVIGRFQDHGGFDGIMFGHPGTPYHFEFTRNRTRPFVPSPTPEDLIVFYVPDADDWLASINRLSLMGAPVVSSLNPYWDQKGKTFQDPDGYRIVIQRASWR